MIEVEVSVFHNWDDVDVAYAGDEDTSSCDGCDGDGKAQIQISILVDCRCDDVD